MSFKVIIAGARKFNDYHIICRVMDNLLRNVQDEIIIVSGTAPGADKLGERYGEERGYEIDPYPADWDDITVPGAVVRVNKLGKPYNAAAGHFRNEKMARDSGAVACVVFRSSASKNKGSNNMVENARKYKLKLRVYDDGVLTETE